MSAFERICTCGYTDWCSDNDTHCADKNPQLWQNLERSTPVEKPPLAQLAAPLLEKYNGAKKT